MGGCCPACNFSDHTEKTYESLQETVYSLVSEHLFYRETGHLHDGLWEEATLSELPAVVGRGRGQQAWKSARGSGIMGMCRTSSGRLPSPAGRELQSL